MKEVKYFHHKQILLKKSSATPVLHKTYDPFCFFMHGKAMHEEAKKNRGTTTCVLNEIAQASTWPTKEGEKGEYMFRPFQIRLNVPTKEVQFFFNPWTLLSIAYGHFLAKCSKLCYTFLRLLTGKLEYFFSFGVLGSCFSNHAARAIKTSILKMEFQLN